MEPSLINNEGVQCREHQHCPICKKPGERVYNNLSGKLYNSVGIWNLDQCKEHSIYWLNPQPLADELVKLYEGYHTQNSPKLKFLSGIPRVKLKLRAWVLAASFEYKAFFWQKIIGFGLSLFLKKSAIKTVNWVKGPVGKILDIGCGSGEFLKKMEALGWQSEGIEFDPISASQARELGLKIYEKNIEELVFAANSFDAIMMSHVIEHLPDPLQTLKECARVLKPGGRIVIITPNINSTGHSHYRQYWRGLEYPRHLFLFSEKSLREYLIQAGLQVDKSLTSMRSQKYMREESERLANQAHASIEKTRRQADKSTGEELIVTAIKNSRGD